MRACNLFFMLAGIQIVCSACGANAPSDRASEALVPDPLSAPANDVSRATQALEAAASSSANADAGTVDASAPSPSITKPAKAQGFEVKDECTPTAKAFEERARPALRACYAVAKKSQPTLEGSLRLTIKIDVRGRLKSVTAEDITLPAEVASCMVKAVKKTPFPDVDKCWDATLTIPMAFPTPK